MGTGSSSHHFLSLLEGNYSLVERLGFITDFILQKDSFKSYDIVDLESKF